MCDFLLKLVGTYYTLILKALLKPLAKNPPKGPITDAKIDIKKA